MLKRWTWRKHSVLPGFRLAMGYTLFYLSALVPWTTFASALSSSALSMEANAHLISKIYYRPNTSLNVFSFVESNDNNREPDQSNTPFPRHEYSSLPNKAIF